MKDQCLFFVFNFENSPVSMLKQELMIYKHVIQRVSMKCTIKFFWQVTKDSFKKLVTINCSFHSSIINRNWCCAQKLVLIPRLKFERKFCKWIESFPLGSFSKSFWIVDTQLTFTCSKSTLETPENGVKYVQR